MTGGSWAVKPSTTLKLLIGDRPGSLTGAWSDVYVLIVGRGLVSRSDKAD